MPRGSAAGSFTQGWEICHMDIGSLEEKKIHISNLDEFLASALLECQEKPIKLSIHKEGIEGYVSVNLLKFQSVSILWKIFCKCVNPFRLYGTINPHSDFLNEP